MHIYIRFKHKCGNLQTLWQQRKKPKQQQQTNLLFKTKAKNNNKTENIKSISKMLICCLEKEEKQTHAHTHIICQKSFQFIECKWRRINKRISTVISLSLLKRREKKARLIWIESVHEYNQYYERKKTSTEFSIFVVF